MIKEQQEAMSRHRSIRIPLPRQQEERRAKRRRHETEEEEEASAVVVKLVERIQQIEAQELQEQPASGHYALFMWPSAMVLAHFIAQRSQLFEHKVVMELGCGTALPGILTALCAHPKQVRGLIDPSDWRQDLTVTAAGLSHGPIGRGQHQAERASQHQSEWRRPLHSLLAAGLGPVLAARGMRAGSRHHHRSRLLLPVRGSVHSSCSGERQ